MKAALKKAILDVMLMVLKQRKNAKSVSVNKSLKDIQSKSMSKIILIILGLATISLSSCKKECFVDDKCLEQPLTDPTCSAYFENWIYNAKENKCEFIGYSGCSPIGFDSEAECQECDCQD
jgi:hypothetical protein